MIRLILSLLISFPLFADFIWEGQNYHLNSKSQQTAALELLNEIPLRGDESILDAGCGDGKITKELALRVPEGSVVGIDLSPSQIAFAKTLETKNLFFEVGDIQELPFNEKFDLATCLTAIQWVPDQAKAFKSLYQTLKPQGKLLLTLPIGITWQLSEAVREVISREEWKTYPFRDKQFFFSREAYAIPIRNAGFRIESFKILPSYNLFANRGTFTAFVKQWLPFAQDVPHDLRDEFMRQIMDVYLELLPPSSSGEVFFEKYVYHLILVRP